MISTCVDKIIKDFQDLKNELLIYEARLDHMEDQFDRHKKKQEDFTNDIINAINRYNNDNIY